MSEMHLILHCRVSVIYPQDCVSNWELQLSVAAQLYETVSHSLLLAWEKTENQNLNYGFY